MNRTALVTTEKKLTNPILIVDKDGRLGKALALKLKREFLTVFVSKNKNINEENIVSVPFLKKFPSIPDNIYSHIILIGYDQASKQNLKVFSKKAQKDGSEILLILTLNSLNKKIIAETHRVYEKIKVIIVGELFSKDFIYSYDTEIGKLISSSKRSQSLEIANDGAKEELPVLLDDAIDAITQAIFVEEKHKLFYVFPQNKTSLLSIVLMLKKKNPHLRLDFVKRKEKNKKKYIIPEGGKYMLENPYNFDEKIKNIDLERIEVEEKGEKFKKRRIGFGFFEIFVFLISLVLLPVASTFLFILAGNGFSKSTSVKSLYLASKSFGLASFTFPTLSKELNFISQNGIASSLEKEIILGKQKTNILFSLSTSSTLINNLLRGYSKDFRSDITNLYLESKKAYVLYEERKLSGLNDLKAIKNLNDLLNISSATIDFWPKILGYSEKKNYLVLLQNNLELRPGGGVINYFVTFTIDKGKILDFKINNTSVFDNMQSSRAEPPFAIRRYLQSVNWGLKDSSFNVDFSKGAIASSVFLNSETGESVDGVLGVDLYFARDLLKITGPIKVEDTNNLVGFDNFFQVVNEKGNDFLGLFYNALAQKLSKDKEIFNSNLISLVANSMYEKHLVFALGNKNEQSAFSINGWSSALSDERNISESLNDFIGINEANLSKNNANYFIKRDVSQKISLDDNGVVNESLQLKIINSSKDKGQGYKNYLRFILPNGAKISGITINKVKQKIVQAIDDPSIYEKKDFNPPDGLEVESYYQDNKTVYGFFLTVNSAEEKTVVIDYTLSQKLDFTKGQAMYNQRIFKQPGIDSFSYKLSLNLPKNVKLTKYPKGFVLTQNGAEALLQITRDEDFNLELSYQ